MSRKKRLAEASDELTAASQPFSTSLAASSSISNSNAAVSAPTGKRKHQQASPPQNQDAGARSSSSTRSVVSESQSEKEDSGVTTVSYTYDTFFISDGRSRRKTAPKQPGASSGEVVAAVATGNSARPRYTCSECGKHYATSSNLSRHKQTHRSVDSQLAKKCPTCNKVRRCPATH